MPIPDDDYMESSNQNMCINFFETLFSINELKKHIEFFDPLNVERRSLKKESDKKNFNKSKKNRKTLYEILNLEKENDSNKLAHCLYDLVGPNFLYEIRGAKPNDKNSKTFRYILFKKSIDDKRFHFDTVNKIIKGLSKTEKGILNLEVMKEDVKIKELEIPGDWQFKMHDLLSTSKARLPHETIEMPQVSTTEIKNHFTISAIRELRPLHDYQIYAGKKIIDNIQSMKGTRKRILISIPTGAGKTRLVAESLIDWLHTGRKSKDENIRNSKYMIWIAQSRELCEQAISQFEEIYSKKGESTLDVYRFYGDTDHKLETILRIKPKNYGLIVGTIDKFYAVIPNKPKIKSNLDPDSPDYENAVNRAEIPRLFYNDLAFAELRNLTSCITIDEAHKGITGSYTAVLRGFGFNFAFTSDENKLNENGITLVGLTATAFRGTGLEKSSKVKLTKPFMNEVTIVSSNNNIRIPYPSLCSVCKKPLPIDEEIFQSTSNKKNLWHTNENNLSKSTKQLYSRFSDPIIPRIHAFQENTCPKAIITCNEKFVANDPMRISGDKSFDPQGEIKKYLWVLEKTSSDLTEVFGIHKKISAKIPIIPDIQTFLIELAEDGDYKITLTVENSDGQSNSDSKSITIIPQKNSEKSEEMRTLIENLIKRNILCIVYHSFITTSSKYFLKSETKATQQTELLPLVAQNQERNQKIIDIIQYVLEKPKNKRKKILVFSCDISHARLLSMWLRMLDISVDYVDSKLSTSRNVSKIKKFRKKSKTNGKVLINTNMLTTGFDVPDVDCVIMGRPVMSTVEYTQMIGRGMRGTRMGGTKNVWIIDFDDQVQRSEKMSNQTIPLGWRSMAYDQEGNQLWKKLSEEMEDDNVTPLNLALIENPKNKETPDRETHLEESNSEIFISISQMSTSTNSNKQFSETNDPWIEFIESQKTDPFTLELVEFIVSNSNERIEIDISSIIDLRKIVKRILGNQNDLSNKKINNIFNNYDSTTISILEKMFEDSKEKIQKYDLIKFSTADIIIIQKPINDSQKIIKLCKKYIVPQDLTKNLLYQKQLNKPKVSIDEQLLEEFIKITYKILGFIPDEKHFKKYISTELYDFLIKHHITYEGWRYGIKIIDHMERIEIRSQCLNQAIELINKTKKNPTMEILESKISKFDEKIIENFFQISIFLKMVKDIFESKKNTTKNMTFAEIDQDYQYVKNINQFEPKTEQILRYSKIGIGHYLKYCGNISNFVQIRELSPNKIPKTNNSIREHLEILKTVFSVLKESLKHIPTEAEMRLHSNYSLIIEYLWFDSYSEFLDFLGEDPSDIERPLDAHQSESSRDEIIKESKNYVNKNGSRSLFEKILNERLEIKYIINFKSIEQFIEILFPSNKEMMKKIWFDMKKNI